MAQGITTEPEVERDFEKRESAHGAPRSMVLNMGPQHPSTHGVLRLLLELDGETILKAAPDHDARRLGRLSTAEGLPGDGYAVLRSFCHGPGNQYRTCC